MRIFTGIPAALLVLTWLGACGVGSGSFSGDIGGRAFHPEGTVFGFVDALEGAPELKGRDHPRVIAALSWVAFDPAYDLEHSSGTEIADLTHAIEVNDWLSLRWDDRDDVSSGASFTDTLLVGRIDGHYDDSDSTAEGRSDGFAARFGLARETLEPGASYSDYRPFGTRAVVTAHVEEVDLEPGGQLKGKVTIKVERIQSDPADARTGTVEGEFAATMVGERIAEKNFETLDLYELLEVRK